MRAVGYTRVSHKEQVDGHSLDAQVHSIRTFCTGRGWTLAHIYTDAGHSARKDSHRPAFEQMLQDARAGLFDVLVVDKLDRFYRHLRGCLATLDELRSYCITFVSVRENLDFSTPWGKLTLTVLGTLAEIYIDNLRQETRKGKLQRARKGLYNGSIPIGYCRGNCSTCTDPNGKRYCLHYGCPDKEDEGDIIPHPIESAAVKLAFEWYATGQFSDGVIAERLNAHEHTLPDGSTRRLRTKGLPGRFPPGLFSKDSVREMLQRRFYTGVVVYYGTDKRGRKRKRDQYDAIFPGQHEALIPDELFDRCQEVRHMVGNGPRTRKRRSTMPYPLTGLLYCGRCGGKMRGQSSRGRRVYTCSSRSQHRKECDQPRVDADEIESKLIEVIRNLPIPDDWEAKYWATLKPEQTYEEMLEQEKAIKARWDRALELYLSGRIPRDRLDDEKLTCDHRVATLRSQEFSAIIAVVKTLEQFDELWHAASPLQKKRLLRVMISAAQLNTQGPLLGQLCLTETVYTLVRFNSKYGSDGGRISRRNIPAWRLSPGFFLVPSY